MKEFLNKYKWTILKTLIVIVVIVGIAIGTYFILRAAVITTKEDFIDLRDKVGDNVFFWFIIAGLQIIQVIFIPVTNQIITVPMALVFNNELWKVHLTSWLSIWFATLILYWIGRVGGPKILKWILNDEKQVERCTRWLNKGWIFYPICMLLPIPDDILTTLAGTAKLKFWFVALCAFFTRGIDTAFSVYGYGYLTKFWWGWVIMIGGTLFMFLLTFLLWRYDKKKKEAESLQESESVE